MGASSNRHKGIWAGSYAAWFVLAACGGGGAEASAPPATPHDKTKPAANDEAADEDSTAEEESAPPRAACDDGTCSPCGSGMCPTGWYCDESVSGGPACSWLPKCAQKSSCACVSNALGSACKCSEQNGGLHVTCK